MWWVNEIMLVYDGEEKEAYHGILSNVNELMCYKDIYNGLKIACKPNIAICTYVFYRLLLMQSIGCSNQPTCIMGVIFKYVHNFICINFGH